MNIEIVLLKKMAKFFKSMLCMLVQWICLCLFMMEIIVSIIYYLKPSFASLETIPSIVTWCVFITLLFVEMYKQRFSRHGNMVWFCTIIFFTPVVVAIGPVYDDLDLYEPVSVMFPYGIEILLKLGDYWLCFSKILDFATVFFSKENLYVKLPVLMEKYTLITVTISWMLIFLIKNVKKQKTLFRMRNKLFVINIFDIVLLLIFICVIVYDFTVNNQTIVNKNMFIEYNQVVFYLTMLLFTFCLFFIIKTLKEVNDKQYRFYIGYFLLFLFTPTIISLDITGNNLSNANLFVKPYGIQLISKLLKSFCLFDVKYYFDIQTLWSKSMENIYYFAELMNIFITPCFYVGFIIHKKRKSEIVNYNYL